MSVSDWISKLFEKRSSGPDMRGVLAARSIYGFDTAAGVHVSPDSALTNTAVWACVKVLSESVASLPLMVYEDTGTGRRRASETSLYRLLHDAPNPEMTSIEMRETMTAWLATWGNAYCEIELDGAGQARALWPLRPDRVEIRRVDGDLTYFVTFGDETAALPRWRVWHVRGLATDGIYGISPIRQARQAIGLAMATEEYGARFFGNGARPGMILEHPGKLSDESYRRLKESWEARHQGLENSNRVAILEEGMKVETVGVPPNEAQFLETRKLQLDEICRIFRVPPHMIMNLERATFSNIEHQGMSFVRDTLMPWLIRFEQSISRDLMTESQRGRYYARHLVDALLRGDTQSRYAAYAVGRQWGWLSVNDIRRLEDMDPVTNGDVYLTPLNMVEAGSDLTPVRGTGGPEEERGLALADENIFTRSKRAASARHKLIGTARPVLEDAAKRIVKREVNDIRAAGRKMLQARDSARFVDWLAEFYRQHTGFAERQLTPALESYAGMILDAVTREIGGEVAPERADAFVRAYIRSAAAREGAINEASLMRALEAARGAGRNELEALEEALDEMDADAPARTAQTEGTRFNNALAKMAYGALGVTALRWVSFGDNCPWCDSLDGRVIGIEQVWVGNGDAVEVDGAEPLRPGSDIGHPPLHKGCDCMITNGG